MSSWQKEILESNPEGVTFSHVHKDRSSGFNIKLQIRTQKKNI